MSDNALKSGHFDEGSWDTYEENPQNQTPHTDEERLYEEGDRTRPRTGSFLRLIQYLEDPQERNHKAPIGRVERGNSSSAAE